MTDIAHIRANSSTVSTTSQSTGGGATVFYASLVGPGETISPGALTQTGPFTVNGVLTATSSNGITLTESGGGNILIHKTTFVGSFTISNAGTGGLGIVSSQGGLTIQNSSAATPLQIIGTSAGDGITISDASSQGLAITTSNGNIIVNCSALFQLDAVTVDIEGSALTNIGSGGAGAKLLFFNGAAGGATHQTITGMLSAVTDANAKAVLTSLIAALATTIGYGLVIDGTT